MMNDYNILKKAVFILLFLFSLMTGIQNGYAATYYSRASGNWTANTTWSTTSGGGAVGAGIFPVSGDIVYIERGYTITVTENATCATITFRNTYTGSSTLTISGLNSLVVTGAFSMNRPSNGYAYNVNVDAGSLTVGSLTMSATNTTRNNIFNISTGSLVINGATSTGTTGCQFNFSGSGTLEFRGTFTSSPTISTSTGSTVVYAYAGNQTVRSTTYSNLVLSGSGTKTTTGITVNGILSREGTAIVSATPTYGTGATLQYLGSGVQTSGSEFPATFNGAGGVIINNANGVNLSTARIIGTTSKLTLTEGILTTTTTNLLSITNTSISAISGGSASSFIDGPVRWTLPSGLVSGSVYNFPLGSGTDYLPFSLVNPTTGTGTITVQAEATMGNSGGSVDGTLASISSTEYWSMTTTGNFTNSSVTITRPTPIAPYGVIGGSTSLAGTYTSLEGTTSDYSISNSNPVASNRYFVFAQKIPTITTSAISGSPFCPGSSVSVPFTITETFNPGNVFTAQLSNSSGSFASPVVLGTLTSTNAGTITGIIPTITSAGAGYRIRVVSNNPIVTGTDNGTNLTVNSAPTITGTTPATRCGPGTLILAATASAGSINWFDALSGGTLLGTGTTFTTPDISSNTTFYAEATNNGCNSLARTPVLATILPQATIAAGGSGSFCSGSTVNLTSSGTNISNQYWVGPNGYYSLLQNPVLSFVTPAMTGTYTVTGSSLSGINLVTNGDFESGNTGFTSGYAVAAATSTGLYPESTYAIVALPSTRHPNFCSCPDNTTGSGSLQMAINGAGVEMNIWSQTVTVLPNTSYQFTYWVQTIVNGSDPNPSKLQLFVNGVNAGPVYTANPTTGVWTQFTYNWTSGTGITSAVLSLKNENFAAAGNDFALDDIIFQQVCDATDIVNIAVASSFVPGVSVIASSNPVCAGTSVTFTATPTNGGTSPSYQWKLNGINVGSNSPTYTNSSLTNGNTVNCVMTPDLACVSPAFATSNSITMTVNPVFPASVSIVASNNPVCNESSVTFTATPTNGGTAPSYQWKLNGANVGTDSPSYTNSTMGNGNTVSCEMTSNAPCATGNPATSNTITMIVVGGIQNNELDFIFGIHGEVCATANENMAATGSAPNGTYFNYVNFSSYGTPGGSCPNFTFGMCHATTSQTIAENNILGNPSFSINAGNSVFGDPCSGTSKRLYIRATYTEPVCAGTMPGTITGSTPTGGNNSYTYLWESSTSGPTSGFSPAAGTNNQQDHTPGALVQTTWFRRTVNSAGCSDVSKVIQITVSGYNTWTGDVGSDWNDVNNWTCKIPDLTSDITISNGLPNYPVLSTGATGKVRNLVIESAASLSITSNILQIAGSISNTGTFNAVNGTIELKGSLAQEIPSNTFETNTINNLIISNPAGASLNGELRVTGVVYARDGNLASDGYLTLVSGSTQTALVDGSGNGEITGNVTMQRALTSGFGYKYLSSPFQAATVSGFADEINLSASFPSFYMYDENKESTGWTDYTNGAGLLNPLKGYCMNFGTSSNPVTADLTGEVNNHVVGPVALYNHNKIYTLGYNLVGNPYPSPINWNAAPGWTKTNIDNALYFFKAGTTDQYGGTYSTYINGVSSDGIANNIIPSMQGFFIHVSDGTFPVSGLFGMDNRVRVNDLSPEFHKSSNENHFPMVRVSAGYTDESLVADPVVIYFTDEASAGFDNNLDALKLYNTDKDVPNLYAIIEGNEKLSINALPLPGDLTSRIPLGLKTEKEGWVTFNTMAIENLPNDLNAYLYDELTGDITDLKDNPGYRVKPGKGTLDQRFVLIFSKTNYISEQSKDDFIAFCSNGTIVIDDGSSPGKNRELTISNMLGQVLAQTMIPETGHAEIQTSCTPGIYILTLISPKNIRSQKIYISHR